MRKPKTWAWDAAAHLETPEDMAAYLDAALDDGDPAIVAADVGAHVRAVETWLAAQTIGAPLTANVVGRLSTAD